MAATRNDSKILIPFLPSLLHLASVKIAIPLLNEFHFRKLFAAFREIQLESKETSEEDPEETLLTNRAKDSLLLIPAHLRKGLMKVVDFLRCEIIDWEISHSFLFRNQTSTVEEYYILYYRKCIFQWRSDGSIDCIKTAKKLVQDENINIRKRFHMACMYCLENSVKTLWTKMQAFKQKQAFGILDNCMVGFWVKYLREESQVPWEQAAREYLESANMEYLRNVNPLMTAYFHLLQPENRQRYLNYLKFTSIDDLRFCLHTVTKIEEDQILKRQAGNLLALYLTWPLKHLFLKAIEKMWIYIDEDSFKGVLSELFFRMKDFEYADIFESFWNRSPNYLRKKARESEGFRDAIDRHFKKIGKEN